MVYILIATRVRATSRGWSKGEGPRTRTTCRWGPGGPFSRHSGNAAHAGHS